ncbi:ras GTPase-activating protein [Collybia nuda]|uniref:Ras GTPase-activating protein n=1 Tax=Collybia nuda TaxID=64659 RepID=A0A9P5Y7B2_9AGAR|nr:ras GTPase-activating protein [Collybia nuda]
MDRPNSTTSNDSLNLKSGSVSGPFPYQTRLLDRTASKSGGNSLSRSNSQTSIFTSPTGSSTSSQNTRRWAPSHRVTNSLDAVRGKWEERTRAMTLEDSPMFVSGQEEPLNRVNVGSSSGGSSMEARPLSAVFHEYGLTASSSLITRTPTALKRRTLPAPIIASPLSPNTTGISVEADSQMLSTGLSHRIHLPLVSSTYLHTSSGQNVPNDNSLSSKTHDKYSLRSQRSNTSNSYERVGSPKDLDSRGELLSKEDSKSYHDAIFGSSATRRKPTSMYGLQTQHTPSSDKISRRPLSSSGFPASPSDKYADSSSQGSSVIQPVSVMSPTPYRSSYMSSKKSSTYGDGLIAGRRLGRHLPRIASGDGEENWGGERRSRQENQDRNLGDKSVKPQPSPETSRTQELVLVGVPNTDDVAGLPGRLQLKAPSTPSPSPSSVRLWADTQRHLIHAYEYLCHVGEAQQWIEGCLGEELGFGVVELEDGLRNGVVLAKLVRTFQGENAVRKIYEAPKLDFRHSDNINAFFNFVRQVGLPEGFIFELTDLYEKKNLPKVIYCIHALSHLLSRRGMAERIGNLLGQLQFSDDQLQRTQKGLKDAGVTMPNFGNVGRELAKEINEEVEVEVETEDERRDRLLLEGESSIIGVQALARGFLMRRARATLQGRIRLTERHTPRLQARCRGFLIRQGLRQAHQMTADLIPWIVSLQATARGIIYRGQWHLHLLRVQAASNDVVRIQAQLRGVLQRRRHFRLMSALRTSSVSVTKLQAIARARLKQNARFELFKSFTEPFVDTAIIALQAHARGVLARRQFTHGVMRLQKHTSSFIALQGHCRGILIRRRMRSQLAKLEDNSAVVVRIQATTRRYLARKRLLLLIRGLRKATPIVMGLQARARANLARQKHHNINKALAEIKTVVSVGTFQAVARAALVRNQHRELHRTLDFSIPDVIGLQAVARGELLRRDFLAWREHLHRNRPIATLIQAMLRGVLVRRSFYAKMQYYRENLGKVIKIQSLFRAKEMREQYRQLTLGKNVSVGTIKNFVHLLDDSEADFQEEIKVERLRKKVVENIRGNQVLENNVSDLAIRIGLIVQNVKSFEEVAKTKRHGADNTAAHAARASLLAAHGDPFSGPTTLDQSARRKLELYQQLFYLLQTRGEYLSRLFTELSAGDTPENNRHFTERVVLTLFGYGQDHREDYLLLKLFQHAIRQEISSASTPNEIIADHPIYINIAIHYARPKQRTYAREAFQTIIREVVDAKELDLEADPSVIHKTRIDLEELRSGIPSTRPKELTFREALKDPDTRPIYIRHLQVLQLWTEAFVSAITQSTKKMPYVMRYLARETLVYLKERFPDAPDEVYAACIARIVYYRYINPAIIAPEAFDVVNKTITDASRMNLAQISTILTQISGGSEFGDDQPIYVPINDFVRKAISEVSTWLIEVANVPDAETHFHAHEFLDATVQPKPIYISPNEIYTIHRLLSQHQDKLAPKHDDTLRIILAELDGVPNLGNDELKDARDIAITLELTNRFAHVRDPHAEEKTLWVQAKRGVLAILRVQPAQDLLESLMRPVTEEDELNWEEILEAETENEQVRQAPRRQPSAAAAESAYRLEDIRSLKFAAVKALAISNLLDLEKQGKIAREDGFQGILNAIAGDVRSKHRKRLQRQQEMESMNDALRHLAERKTYFEEQINSYNDYIEAGLSTMQRGKGKKRFVLPFTKQYFHLRDLQKSGQNPQFGSYLYTAKDLYDKGILLSVDKFSPRQFDKILLTMSSNTAGVFTLVLETTMFGATSRIASEDVLMEDLLKAKYEKRSSLSLFKGKVKVNFELFLYQINKKFYV